MTPTSTLIGLPDLPQSRLPAIRALSTLGDGSSDLIETVTQHRTRISAQEAVVELLMRASAESRTRPDLQRMLGLADDALRKELEHLLGALASESRWHPYTQAVQEWIQAGGTVEPIREALRAVGGGKMTPGRGPRSPRLALRTWFRDTVLHDVKPVEKELKAFTAVWERPRQPPSSAEAVGALSSEADRAWHAFLRGLRRAMLHRQRLKDLGEAFWTSLQVEDVATDWRRLLELGLNLWYRLARCAIPGIDFSNRNRHLRNRVTLSAIDAFAWRRPPKGTIEHAVRHAAAMEPEPFRRVRLHTKAHQRWLNQHAHAQGVDPRDPWPEEAKERVRVGLADLIKPPLSDQGGRTVPDVVRGIARVADRLFDLISSAGQS